MTSAVPHATPIGSPAAAEDSDQEEARQPAVNAVIAADSNLIHTASWMAGFGATGDTVVARDELVEQGLPVSQVNARLVRQHEEEVLLMHFRCWIMLFSVIVCLATPAMFALLVWLCIAYLDGGDVECDVPIQMWTQVVFVIVFYNFTLNRPTPRGSCVQRVFCLWQRDADDDTQPMPFRVWLYNLFFISATFVWNCIGLHWASFSSSEMTPGGLPLCREVVPNLHSAVRAYATFNLAMTLFMYANMFGFAQLLRLALHRGFLYTPDAAPKGSLESNTEVISIDNPLILESPSCSICLEDFEASPSAENVVVETKLCRHVFHKQCLKGWLQVNRTCPLCRQDLGNLAKAPSAAWS